jgi:hypothetical protein
LKRFWAALSFITLVGLTTTTKAQVAIYGMGSGGYLSAVNSSIGPTTLSGESFSAYGGTLGAYDTLRSWGPVKFGADARGFIESSTNSDTYGNQLRGLMGGARLALFSHAVPFSPYFQAEIGGVGTNYGTQSTRSTSFSYQIQGGLDYTIFPHLDGRFEYGAGQIGAFAQGQRQEMQQIGLGLVVRIF